MVIKIRIRTFSELALQEEDSSGLKPFLLISAGHGDVDEGQDLLARGRVVERQPHALVRTVVVGAGLQDPGKRADRYLPIEIKI